MSGRRNAPLLPVWIDEEPSPGYAAARFVVQELTHDDQSSLPVSQVLADFCRALAENATEVALRQALHSWLSAHLTEAADSPITPKGGQAKRGGAHVVSVRLAPHPSKTEHVELNVVLHDKEGTIQRVDSEAVSSAAKRARAEALIGLMIESEVPDDANLIVEFILPRRWLSLPVDEWSVGEPKTAVTRLGWRHVVVVKDRATFDRESPVREHRRRWLQVAGTVGSGATLHSVACCPSPSQMKLAAQLSVDQAIAVVSFPTPPEKGRKPALDAVLENGVPVVVWHRRSCSEAHGGPQPCSATRLQAALIQTIEQLLTASALTDLPETVRRLRAAAGASYGSDEHVGSQLTLLWDDPGMRVRPILTTAM